jgi:hypothetical protein
MGRPGENGAPGLSGEPGLKGARGEDGEQVSCLILIVVYLFDGVYHPFQQYFSYIVAVSFIGGGNWWTRKKPLTCRKSLSNFIT